MQECLYLIILTFAFSQNSLFCGIKAFPYILNRVRESNNGWFLIRFKLCEWFSNSCIFMSQSCAINLSACPEYVETKHNEFCGIFSWIQSYSVSFSSAKRMLKRDMCHGSHHHAWPCSLQRRQFPVSVGADPLEQRCCLSGIIWQHADRILCFSTQHAQHCVFLKKKRITNNKTKIPCKRLNKLKHSNLPQI